MFDSSLRSLEDQKRNYYVSDCACRHYNIKKTVCAYDKYLICGISDSEHPQGVVSECLAAFQRHLVWAVFLLVPLGPVLLTFGLWESTKNIRISRHRRSDSAEVLEKALSALLLKCETTDLCAAVCSPSSPYPSFLLEVGDHDNNANILLPDHSPEVFSARSERPLSGDVRPRSLITLQTAPGCSSGIGESNTQDDFMEKLLSFSHKKHTLTSTKFALM